MSFQAVLGRKVNEIIFGFRASLKKDAKFGLGNEWFPSKAVYHRLREISSPFLLIVVLPSPIQQPAFLYHTTFTGWWLWRPAHASFRTCEGSQLRWFQIAVSGHHHCLQLLWLIEGQEVCHPSHLIKLFYFLNSRPQGCGTIRIWTCGWLDNKANFFFIALLRNLKKENRSKTHYNLKKWSILSRWAAVTTFLFFFYNIFLFPPSLHSSRHCLVVCENPPRWVCVIALTCVQ